MGTEQREIRCCKTRKQVAVIVDEYGFSEILFKGHTDARKGPTFNNVKLSKQRANAAQTYLLQKLNSRGIGSIRSTISYVAETDPIYSQDDSYSRSVNRRVEIVLNHP